MLKETGISGEGKCLGFEEKQRRGSWLREGLSGEVWRKRPMESD